MNEKYYKVGDNAFRIRMDENSVLWNMQASYGPFETAPTESLIFSLDVRENSAEQKEPTELVGEFGTEGALMDLYRDGDGFLFKLAPPKSQGVGRLSISSDFNYGELHVQGSDKEKIYSLDNSLMMLYAFSSIKFNTLLMHASVIKYKNRGYMFLGKSGTGKSTHSRLWLTHIPETELLNDDNPVVKIVDGKATVYGSPWSGKTPCYKNESVELGGVVRLEQAPENKIEQLSFVKAYASILPSCSSMKWEPELGDNLHATIEKFISIVPCYHLRCLPDKAAALLSSATIVQ